MRKSDLDKELLKLKHEIDIILRKNKANDSKRNRSLAVRKNKTN